jgi:hypothetical protein
MAIRITARIDRELDAALRHYAEQNGLTRSQAIREVLRQSLTNAEPITRGWLEGFARGRSEALSAQQQALSGIEPA